MSHDNVSPYEVIGLSVIDDIEGEVHRVDRLLSILVAHLSHFLDECGYQSEIEEACVLSEVIQEFIANLISKLS